jgi:hypothetical protein
MAALKEGLKIAPLAEKSQTFRQARRGVATSLELSAALISQSY